MAAKKSDPAIEWRCYKNTNPGHNKFWKVAVVDLNCVVVYGRIGTIGATQVKTFDAESKANYYANEKVLEKLKKGYVLDRTVVDARSTNATAAIGAVQKADKALESARAEAAKAREDADARVLMAAKAKAAADAKLGEETTGTGRRIVILLDDE